MTLLGLSSLPFEVIKLGRCHSLSQNKKFKATVLFSGKFGADSLLSVLFASYVLVQKAQGPAHMSFQRDDSRVLKL